jgi:acyl-CoA:acyl-CoA alkyltransferase
MEDKIASNSEYMPTAYGVDLHDNLYIKETKLISQWCNINAVDIVFPHMSSKKQWTRLGKAVNIDYKMCHIYQKTGNIASASIPVVINDTLNMDKLKPNDKLLLTIGSASMSFSTTNFRF